MVEGARLEIVCALIAHLGFKSLTLRQISIGSIESVLFFCPRSKSPPVTKKCLANKKVRTCAHIRNGVFFHRGHKITPFPERPTLEEPMRKLISLLVMILLLLSAALAKVSTPTCTTVTLATGSVRGGFHHEDVRGFPGLCGRKPSGNDGWIPVPGGVSKKRQAVRAFCPDSLFFVSIPLSAIRPAVRTCACSPCATVQQGQQLSVFPRRCLSCVPAAG